MKLTPLLGGILALFAIWAPAGQAHESRPLYVQFTETDPGVFTVYWKVPTSLPQVGVPSPVLPDICVPEGDAAMLLRSEAYEFQQRFACSDGLSGQYVGIYFPVLNPSITSLFQVRLANGEQHVRVLEPGEERWLVPDSESRLGVAIEFTALGSQHIWIGIDHLLFIACLLFVAGTMRRLVITVTGFTLAHSLTLALSALDVVRVPVPPVEAAIALSVIFLAYEIIRGDPRSLTYRYPIAIASTFGLLHGFGFAAVLREIGLPQTELPTALLFFNVGVEIGQLLFVGLLIAAFLILRSLLQAIRPLEQAAHGAVPSATVGRPPNSLAPAYLSLPAAFVIGGLATFWMIERVSGFWS